MTKINVLLFTTTLEVGGTEKITSILARGFDRRKFNVTVACLSHGGEVAKELRSAGIDVQPLNMKSKFDFTVLLRLYRLLRSCRVDILHSFLFHANLLGRIVGRFAGVPVIISSERTMGMEGKHRALMNKFTSPLASAFTANSNAVSKFMVEEIGLPKEKIYVIYNGVDAESFKVKVNRKKVRESLVLDEHDFVVVSVARLTKLKGFEYLLEAAEKIIAGNSKVKFLIVGDGPNRKNLEEKSGKLGLGGNVIFLGFRDDIAQILSASDLFVLPTIWEGFPNTILEAMAAGLAVVATNTSGIPESVSDGKTGLLFEPRDSEGLYEALESMIKNQEKLKRMGEEGREKILKNFSIQKMINENERLYEKLLNLR